MIDLHWRNFQSLQCSRGKYTRIIIDTRISLRRSLGQVSFRAKTTSISPTVSIKHRLLTDCYRQTHFHSTALVERHAGKDSRLQMTSQFIFVSRLLQNYLLRLCLYRLFRLIAPGVNDKPEQYSNNRYKKLAGLLRAMNSKEPIGVAT